MTNHGPFDRFLQKVLAPFRHSSEKSDRSPSIVPEQPSPEEQPSQLIEPSPEPAPAPPAPPRMRDLLAKEVVLQVCDVGEEGYKLIESSAFQSQRSYNAKRGLKVANLLRAQFKPHQFAGKKILELGPGHYAFALLARHLGAEVVCVERDPSFAELGRHLGFEVLEVDFADLDIKNFDRPFDGLWMKGSFNACTQKDEASIHEFVRKITDLITPEGWGWMVTVNKVGGEMVDAEAFAEHRIEVQRQAFVQCGWDVTPIQDSDRPTYALNYTGGYYYFTRNLTLPKPKPPASPPEESSSSLPQYSPEKTSPFSTDNIVPTIDSSSASIDHDVMGPQVEEFFFTEETLIADPASENRPLNRVSRLWKPTPEYWLSPWQHFVDFIHICKQRNVKFLTMSQALAGKYDPNDINLLLDHHIDYYPIETHVMCRWELENGVVSNVYIFNQSPYQDVSQRKNWRVEDIDIPFYQSLEQAGFEIGYHQNSVGIAMERSQTFSRTYQSELSAEIVADAKVIFSEDVKNLKRYFNIRTFIPHGGGEANARLLDVPEDCRDLVWVYNNARQNGTTEPPLKWKNYSDSVGTSPQRIRGFKGEYVARRGNLLLAAWMLEPGLNHVLIHPGRFSKGMPYELWPSELEKTKQNYTSEQYLLPDGLAKPVLASRFLSQWLPDSPLVAASGNPTPEDATTPTAPSDRSPQRTQPGFLFTDEPEVLKRWFLTYDVAVPVLVYHRPLGKDDKKLLVVERPVSIRFRLPDDRCPDGLSPEEATECFLEQFASFFSVLYSEHCLRHLEDCGMEPLGLVLHHVQAKRFSDLQAIIGILSRMAPEAEVSIRLFGQREEAEGWQKKADALLGKARKRSLPHIHWQFAEQDQGWMLHITAPWAEPVVAKASEEPPKPALLPEDGPQNIA